jgi:hypothetical protein
LILFPVALDEQQDRRSTALDSKRAPEAQATLRREREVQDHQGIRALAGHPQGGLTVSCNVYTERLLLQPGTNSLCYCLVRLNQKNAPRVLPSYPIPSDGTTLSLIEIPAVGSGGGSALSPVF